MATIETQAHAEVKVGSNRSFGLVFAVVFGLIGVIPLVSGGPLRVWALIVAGVFLLPAILFPQVLEPLNRLWFRLGMLLSKIVNPVVMLLIYVIAILPTGLIMRLLGKDLLRLKFDQGADTYWISREPPGPTAESYEDQF